MNAREFLGAYLQKEDIPDAGIAARIRDAKKKQFEEDERPKLILYFDGLEKGLLCNITNINVLIDVLGSDDINAWFGRQIELYVDHGVMFAGKRVGGIRVRAVGVQLKSSLEPKAVDPQPPAN